jgi:catechol 2,3-dioxygenase-like lactoylglutathione lyase family enzyme
MAVVGFNHFNIRAPGSLMAMTRQFYTEILGLEEGFRPDFPFKGHWLYIGDLPVIHLMEWQDGPDANMDQTHYLDHVAFTCEELDGFIARLERLAVAFTRRDVEIPDRGGFTQLNLTDPTGTGVELNFAW